MIYLFRDMKPEDLKKANDAYLGHFICSAAGHPPATRQGFNSVVCLCGAWARQVTWPADDEVSMVTVDALRGEVRQCQSRITVLREALELAVETLQGHGEFEVSADLINVLNGKATV